MPIKYFLKKWESLRQELLEESQESNMIDRQDVN